MGKVRDLVGHRFGRLVVLEMTERNRSGNVLWKAQCDCGVVRVVAGDHLCRGTTRSCGCFSREVISNRNTTHGDSRFGRRTCEYGIWKTMIARCGNSSVDRYSSYGERGIRVCDRWCDFRNFLEDMGRRPTPQHSIDRIDNDGNYEPGNCRWATRSVQSRNKRSTVLLTFMGRTQCMTDWARELGILVPTLCMRLKSGVSIEEALSRKVQTRCKKAGI